MCFFSSMACSVAVLFQFKQSQKIYNKAGPKVLAQIVVDRNAAASQTFGFFRPIFGCEQKLLSAVVSVSPT